ncbi:MAG: hypothetical protein Q8L48_37170 [Archangium sp.]|nr:hypothetical protein [Archangium sp.]
MRTPLRMWVLVMATSCGVEVEATPEGEVPRGSCGCIAPDEPWTGEALLRAHVDEKTWLGSVISFRYGTTVEDGQVSNDWDLSLTPSTREARELTFRVNLVTDDRSCIEDLGAIAIADVPATLTRCDDFVKAVEGHVYLVENRDQDQQQLAAFAVTTLDRGHSATLRWYRSAQPDRFTFER